MISSVFKGTYNDRFVETKQRSKKTNNTKNIVNK
jgi:hypothetical protein